MRVSVLGRAPLVLAYHAIGDVDPAKDAHSLFTPVAAFRRQVEQVARRRRVVPLQQVVDGVAPARSVALTFDDGYRSVLEHGLPVLRRLGLPSTMFVPTAYVGDRNRWNEPTGLDLSIMSADELRACEDAGMRMESHGHAHLDMRVTSREETLEDLRRSREVLTDLVGRTPDLLAWPFRTGSPEAQDAARELGFRAAFSIDLPPGGALARPRVQISPQDGDLVFRLKTSGRYLELRHGRATDVAYRRLVKPLLKNRWAAG